MGDLANMTSVHGEVDGFRLLRWLRSREQVQRSSFRDCILNDNGGQAACHRACADMLREMADDLERELTPPDYPEDDGGGVDLDDTAAVDVVVVPGVGREVRRNSRGKWEAQPWNDNYWMEFDNLAEAMKAATPPVRE